MRLPSTASSGSIGTNVDAKSLDDPVNTAGIATLLRAMGYIERGVDPYAGKTGLFEAAYLSEADGTGQPFMLAPPAGYTPERHYCLMLTLHGAGGTHYLQDLDLWKCAPDSAWRGNTIVANVCGRGRYSQYEGLGEDDILQVIRWVKERYSVDENRVYITGGSMGGGGTWKILARYPDLFASGAADCGWAPLPLVPNMVNVPTYINHGDADWVVPVGNSRLGVQTMQESGCQVEYNEFPGITHAVDVSVCQIGRMRHMGLHQRDSEPRRARVHTDHPRSARNYWAEVAEWDDPHRLVTLDVSIGEGDTVRVTMSNVARAVIEPPAQYLSGNRRMTWVINDRNVRVRKSRSGAYIIVADGDGFAVRRHEREREPTTRRYAAGGLMNLYHGEPLLIVRGTQADAERLAGHARMASRWLMPWRDMEFGSVPVVADTAVTEEQLSRCNLYLVGGPNENTVTRRLMARMPIREEGTGEGRVLRIFDEDPTPLPDSTGYAFVYPNPEHPERLVYVHATYWPGLVPGSWQGLCSPDLIVDRPRGSHGEGLLTRAVQFTHGWRPTSGDRTGSARLRPLTMDELAPMFGDVQRSVTGSDFAVVSLWAWDKGRRTPFAEGLPWCEREPILRGQLLDDCLPSFVVFEASGRDLLRFAPQVAEQGNAILPQPDSTAINPDGRYRVSTQTGGLWAFASAEYSPENMTLVGNGDAIRSAMRRVWRVGVSERR